MSTRSCGIDADRVRVSALFEKQPRYPDWVAINRAHLFAAGALALGATFSRNLQWHAIHLIGRRVA
ncbi:MAG: hypothetical protein ABIZ64_12575 [Casimicrobium sp.]